MRPDRLARTIGAATDQEQAAEANVPSRLSVTAHPLAIAFFAGEPKVEGSGHLIQISAEIPQSAKLPGMTMLKNDAPCRLLRPLSPTHAVICGSGVAIGAGTDVRVGAAARGGGMRASLALVGAAMVMSLGAVFFAG